MDITQDQLDWLQSNDSGLSSKTILYYCIGDKSNRIDYPLDPSDFGRCYRLLKKFPEFKTKFVGLSELSEVWEKYIDNWDKMEKLFEEETVNGKGRAEKLYNFMNKLQTDGF